MARDRQDKRKREREREKKKKNLRDGERGRKRGMLGKLKEVKNKWKVLHFPDLQNSLQFLLK